MAMRNSTSGPDGALELVVVDFTKEIHDCYWDPGHY